MTERRILPPWPGTAGADRRRYRSSWMAAMAMLLGIIVLLGWAVNLPLLPRLFTQWPAMQPLTAVLLVLSGLTLVLQATHRFRAAAVPLAIAILLTGSALLEHIGDRSLGIDALLFRDAVLAQVDDPFPGRIRIMNAVGILVFCLCMAMPRRTPGQYRRIGRLATLGLAFPFATLCGYVIGAHGFEGMVGAIAMSMPAALGQVLLFLGILYAQRGTTWLHLLHSRSPGGRTARSLLPLILGWPLAVGLVINLTRPSSANPQQVLALALVAVMMVQAAVVLRFARRLDHEVAARRSADTARQESEERYRSVVETASEGIVTINRHGDIVYANPAASRIFGYAIEEMLGSKLTMVMSEAARTPYENALADYLETGRKHGPWAGAEVTGRHRDGRPIPLEISYVEFCRNGERLFTGIVHDISLRKQAEAELKQLNESLEQRVRERTAELSRSNEALMQNNQELQRFAYIASHDLQTPLRSISGFVQLLQQHYGGELDERADTWIRLVIDNTQRLQILIQELLTYARADYQGIPFKPVDFGELVEEVLEAMATPIRETGAEVTRDALPVVMGDRIQLSQVLQNLLDNAIKYHGEEPPRIHIGAARQDGEWAFSVRDNGIGIHPKYHGRIFELFRRLHTQQAYPGTGIGLAICRKIVHRHGGRIWVESEPGKGSTFRFALPGGEIPG